MFVMGQTGTMQNMNYKGKLPTLDETVFSNTYDKKNVYNFTGATSIRSLNQGTKFSDLYALQVGSKNY